MAFVVGLMAMLSGTTAWSYDAIEQSIRVPIDDLSGQHRLMTGWICRPSGVKRPKLVVINHGSSTIAADRPGLPLASCNNEAVRWFMDRHYAVVQVWRLGYGATGGPWTEGFAHCTAVDYYKAGIETARQISAIVDYSISLPGVDPNGVVVVGHSGGGWGSIAYDGLTHTHVSAVINMAGGRGGHYRGRDNSNCGGDQLAGAAGLFGKASSTLMLWIYADNDSYFGPRLAQEMAAAYVNAGGRLKFVKTPSSGSDGHGLFFDTDGSKIWGPLVQSYLSDDNRQAALPAR
jgi:dienelactone hydrolase